MFNFQTRLRNNLSNRVSLDQISFVNRAPTFSFSRVCYTIFFFFFFSTRWRTPTSWSSRSRHNAVSCRNVRDRGTRFSSGHCRYARPTVLHFSSAFFRPPQFSKRIFDRFQRSSSRWIDSTNTKNYNSNCFVYWERKKSTIKGKYRCLRFQRKIKYNLLQSDYGRSTSRATIVAKGLNEGEKLQIDKNFFLSFQKMKLLWKVLSPIFAYNITRFSVIKFYLVLKKYIYQRSLHFLRRREIVPLEGARIRHTPRHIKEEKRKKKKHVPLSISKFIRSRLNKTRLHREWKEGWDRSRRHKGGALPWMRIDLPPPDFAAQPLRFLSPLVGRWWSSNVRVDRWIAPLFRRAMQSRSRSRQRTTKRFYVAWKSQNRSKRNAIGTTFRASIPTKNRTRNWSASYNTDRCPVAVGRGRELESPFTIIYFKIALYILTRYFVLARTTLSPKRFPLPHYRSLGMVAVIVFLSLELSSKIVLRIILFWRTKFRSNVYFRTRKKNNSCQLFRISFRRKEKNCSFIKLIPVYISE